VLFSLTILRGKNYTTAISKEIFTKYQLPSEEYPHTTVNPQKKKQTTTVFTQPTKENLNKLVPLSNISLPSSEEEPTVTPSINCPQRNTLE
jgi:hypothetical protein